MASFPFCSSPLRWWVFNSRFFEEALDWTLEAGALDEEEGEEVTEEVAEVATFCFAIAEVSRFSASTAASTRTRKEDIVGAKGSRKEGATLYSNYNNKGFSMAVRAMTPILLTEKNQINEFM